MKSPAEMQIIQIEITNACPSQAPFGCANCTRFVGHHKKPFMMDWDTFKLAVDSLRDFPGMVGIMGGEPTLHPEFERMARYLEQARPEAVAPVADARGARSPKRRGAEKPTKQPGTPAVGDPIGDIGEYRNRYWSALAGRKRGLWTSLGAGYVEHFEVIRDVFRYQCVNTHQHPGEHQALLMTRKELSQSPFGSARNLADDAEFAKLRDACWIQNLWSASITPKGAFFCEVAAALDMLTGGPGGWPLESGWWRRRPAEFGEQLQWCELCSGCLAVPRVRANADHDLVSPDWARRLQELGSRKLAAGKVDVFDVTTYDASKYVRNTNDAECYLPAGDNSVRVGTDVTAGMRVRYLEAVLVCVGYAPALERTLLYTMTECDRVTVVTTPEDPATKQVVATLGADLVVSPRRHEGGAEFNKGAMLNDGFRAIYDRHRSDGGEVPWILVTDADIILPEGCGGMIRGMILNPGVLYYAERSQSPFGWTQDSWDLDGWLLEYGQDRSMSDRLKLTDPATNARPWGYFQLFNPRAAALATLAAPAWYSEAFGTAGGVDNHFQGHWDREKQYLLPVRCVHLAHGTQIGVNWRGVDAAPTPERQARRIQGGWTLLGWIDHNGFHRQSPDPDSPRGYYRLVRVDTAEYVLTPRRARRTRWVCEEDTGFGRVKRIGIWGALGMVRISRETRDDWSGWGMGVDEHGRQAWTWAGQPIERTNFELYWRENVPEEDTRTHAAEVSQSPFGLAGDNSRAGEVDKLAVVVCAVRLHGEALRWVGWTREVLEAVDAQLYLVTDEPQMLVLPEWVVTVKYQPAAGELYSPARVSNRGIRAACEAGFARILKTDIDCILAGRLVGQCRALTGDVALAPYYMMAKSVDAADIQAAKAWEQGCGTLCMTGANWKRLCGYDERMEGFGREDGDLVTRARLAGLDVRRAPGRVWHIGHESRQTADWYPMRRAENIEAGKTVWQEQEQAKAWGKAVAHATE